MNRDSALNFEAEIVWETAIDELDYVRVGVERAGTRTRPVPWSGAGKRVGYAVLEKDAPNAGRPGTFLRRVFYLKDGDRHTTPNSVYETGAPVEAVDPRTIEPGKEGELTERARGVEPSQSSNSREHDEATPDGREVAEALYGGRTGTDENDSTEDSQEEDINLFD